MYNQEGDESTGSYAPARIQIEVVASYEPEDDGYIVSIETGGGETPDGETPTAYPDLTQAQVEFKRAIESWFVKHTYETETP